jgi:tRNA pseudouridine38/39 synthase
VALIVKSNVIQPSDPHFCPWKLPHEQDPPLSETLHTQEYCYVTILNRLLPRDIKVLAWSPVLPDFDARFSCIGRKYNYIFPALHLNTELMSQACAFLVGTYNFKNFCKLDKSKPKTKYVRSVYQASIKPLHPLIPRSPESYYIFEVQGKAFLWHQGLTDFFLILL